jgi:hypothetical protein
MNRCDFCKRTDVPLYHALMPRHKKRWVKDAYGAMIMPVYNGIDFLETSICQSCINALASILPEVTVDE